VRGTILRKTVRFLSSPRLAIVLMAFVGLWGVLGSFVPQGAADAPDIAAWAAANPALEPVVSALGLHQAFTALPFIVVGVFLALTTAVCAWQRTGAAWRRSKTLREAAKTGSALAGSAPDLEIALDPALDAADAIRIAGDTLDRLGIPTKRGDHSLLSVSPAWSVWGTGVFHWSLVAIIVLIVLGSLARSSGQMGVAVGQTVEDRAEAYGELEAGPLYRWQGVNRRIRVDAFDLDYRTGEGENEIHHGPTPTVSILNGEGDVLESQLVYPNHTLKRGSLAIYPVDYGLSATVALIDPAGDVTQRATQLIDFSGNSKDGTAPISALTLSGPDGASYQLLVTVPLDRVAEGFLGRVPDVPRAHVVIIAADGTTALDAEVEPGQTIEVPTGGSLQVLAVDYYARLQVVDDHSVPPLLVAGVLAMIGLGVATLVRQVLLAARIEDGPDGRRLSVRMRLWRMHTTSRGEIEDELRRALSAAEGSAS